ncbi:MAG: ASCH domain-containing protein [Myxococcales bacterium]
MKGLTLTQPWASLVAAGVKTIETRSWRSDYRGPIAIHAAKGLAGLRGSWPCAGANPTLDELGEFVDSQPRMLDALLDEYGQFFRAGELPRGAIVAVAVLVDIVSTSDALGFDFIDDELPFGNFAPGRWAWVMSDVKPIKPPVEIPSGAVRNYRGLWDVPTLVRP